MNRSSALCIMLSASLTAGCTTTHSASPYAGQHARSIKALSEKDEVDLLQGAGMGFAKAAELNRHPGPSHVLELSAALELSVAQREVIQEILALHKAEARRLGLEVVRLERELDDLFAKGTASPDGVRTVTANLASVQGALRASHLNAHIATTRLLSVSQIDRYESARGYGAGHDHE